MSRRLSAGSHKQVACRPHSHSPSPAKKVDKLASTEGMAARNGRTPLEVAYPPSDGPHCHLAGSPPYSPAGGGHYSH